jgi:hypothetical protein
MCRARSSASSRHGVDWIRAECFGIFCSDFADELVYHETLEGFERGPGVLGADEVDDIALEMLTAVVVVAFDGLTLSWQCNREERGP